MISLMDYDVLLLILGRLGLVWRLVGVVVIVVWMVRESYDRAFVCLVFASTGRVKFVSVVLVHSKKVVKYYLLNIMVNK